MRVGPKTFSFAKSIFLLFWAPKIKYMMDKTLHEHSTQFLDTLTTVPFIYDLACTGCIKHDMESKANNVRIGDYILKTKIKEGSFSTVWRAEHIFNGKEVAVKQVLVSKLNPRLKACFDCEINFLSSVNHPHIIRLFHIFQVQLFPFSIYNSLSPLL